MGKEISQWITVKGRHIPIFEGESKEDAIKRLKEGARKGKSTRPISKKEYDKKAKAADKAYKAIGSHTERLVKADKRVKEGDNSPEAKKEFMNAERTLKEAGQRFQKRSAEHQEAVKHPKYTSIKVKKGEKRPSEHETIKTASEFGKLAQKYKLSESDLKEVMNMSDNNPKKAEKLLSDTHKIVDLWNKKQTGSTKTSDMSIDKVNGLLKKPDIELGGSMYKAQEQVDAINYMYGYDDLTKARKAILEGKHSDDDIKRAILWWETEGLPYKDRKKAYDMSLKKFGLEKKEEKSWQDKDEEVKQKQMTNAEKQKQDAAQAQKPHFYTNMDLEDATFRNSAKEELKRHQRNWEFYDSKQKRNVSPNGYKELQDRINEIEEYEKKLKGKNGEPKLEYDLGGNLLGRDGKLAKNMSKRELEDWQKEVEKKTDRNKEKVKALRTMAENAEIRKIVTSEQAFEGKQTSWAPKTGDKINDVGHNEAQNKLYDAPTGTTFEMTSRDGDYVGEYTKQSDGSWKGSQKYKSGYKMPPTVYTPKGFAMNVVGKDIKVINDGSEKKADWRDVDTKPQKSKKVNLSATYTNAMNSADTDKVERAIAKLTNNGGSSTQIQELKEKLRRLRHSEYKEDPAHYNGKGMR